MDDDAVSAAMNEANRFLERAHEWMSTPHQYPCDNPRESGALRRASMDLTRALADMRRRN